PERLFKTADTDYLYSLGRLNTSERVLWHDTFFKPESFSFLYPLSEVGNAPYFAAESYLAYSYNFLVHRLILERGVQRQSNRQVCCRLVYFKSAHYIDINVE